MTERYALPDGVCSGATIPVQPVELPNRGSFSGAACSIAADMAT
jgi:hypothetical protein